MAKTALVTGISGFTAPYVTAELLARGYEVHGAGRDANSQAGVHCHQVDLRSPEQLAVLVAAVRPNVVIHLAAIAFVGHQDFTDMYLSNIVGTRNLLEALANSQQQPERVLLASSANIYGNTDIDVLTEDTPFNPQNDYAVSKCAMEMMASLWTDRLPILIVRPFNYTGAGQTPSFLVPKIVGHFARRESVIALGNIDVFRDFSDVRYVADAYVRLLDTATTGGVYNVCSGNEYTIQYILDQLTAITGHSIEVRIDPAFVRANEVQRLKGSNEKLAAAIGPLKSIPLKDTLAWMLGSAI